MRIVIRRALIAVAAAACLLTGSIASAASSIPDTYVALGDSYSSGLGTGSYSLSSTCKRGTYAYPYLVSTARANTALAVIAVPASLAAPPSSGVMPGAPTWAAGPAGGLVRPHEDMGAAKPSGAGGTSPNMTYHNGPVMAAGADVRVIYWGSRWTDTTFAGDKKTGLAELYGGIGTSAYHRTNLEYGQSGGAKVSSVVTCRGALANTSVTPSGAPSTSTVLGVVANALSTAGITPLPC